MGWSAVRRTGGPDIPLHSYLHARLQVFDRLTSGSGPDDVARASAEFDRDPSPWPGPRVDVRDRQIPGPHGPVDIRVYGADLASSGGVVLWVHGGAFFGGSLEMPEAHMVSAELAERAGAAVVSVGYRLAVGGVRHPVPLEDVYAAWEWVRTVLAPDVAAFVGGASAGAALAVGCALLDRERSPGRHTAGLLLAYPFLHHPVPAPGAALGADLTAELVPQLRFAPDFLDDVVRNYVGRIHGVPALALPGLADLSGLPPALVAIAEYDDLRPSGELFVRQVADAGGTVRQHLATGMPHGFLNRTTYLDQVGQVLDLMAETVRSHRSAPPGDPDRGA